jgi:hypothetical protein
MVGMNSGTRNFLVLVAITAVAAMVGKVFNRRPMNLEWFVACAVAVLAIYFVAVLVWNTASRIIASLRSGRPDGNDRP